MSMAYDDQQSLSLEERVCLGGVKISLGPLRLFKNFRVSYRQITVYAHMPNLCIALYSRFVCLHAWLLVDIGHFIANHKLVLHNP